ncbi:MAG: enediyne biosynthesis protein [Acidobacteriota bacterium]|jgi:hypothetical protein|nr:enediyne biosynthesis protein [Acidobacteriota bacterium]
MDMARPTGTDCVKDSRGAAVADFNRDGRLDIVINNNNETPTVYLNNLKAENSLEIKLVGRRSNRDAVGADVRLTTAGKTMLRQVEAGSGYASQSMLPVHFGLGQSAAIDAIEIRWPSGQVQRIEGRALTELIANNRLIRIEETADSAEANARSSSLR